MNFPYEWSESQSRYFPIPIRAQYIQTINEVDDKPVKLPKYFNMIEHVYGTMRFRGRSAPERFQSMKLNDAVKPEDAGHRIAEYFLSHGNVCSKTGYFNTCKDGHVNYKPHHCNDKWNCPICARGRSVSDGRQVFHTLIAGKPHYIAQLVLTLPKDHPMFFTAKEGREAVYRYLYAVADDFMDQVLRGYPYVAVVHSWNTKDPLSDPHWHIHILVSLMKVFQGRVIKGSGYRHPKELVGWRKAWGRISGIPFSRVNLDWQFCYSADTQKIRHWSNYICRRAVLDVNTFLMSHGDPSELSEMEQYWYDFHCHPVRKNFRRIRWYRGLSDSCKRAYLEAVGSHINIVRVEIKKDIQESKRKFCWKCGDELDPLGWVWYPGLIPRKKFALSSDGWSRYKDLVS